MFWMFEEKGMLRFPEGMSSYGMPASLPPSIWIVAPVMKDA